MKKKNKRWEVDVGIPMTASSVRQLWDQFREDYDSHSSGAGFGYYDCQIDAKNESHAKQMAEEMAQLLKQESIKVVINPKDILKIPRDTAYVSWYSV